jgi:hypothetical protein
VVFSYMQGIIHPYYMVALAPAIGALVGVGAMSLWQAGLSRAGRACAAAGVLASGVWAYVLLDRTPAWLPWLRWTVLLAGLAGAAAVLALPLLLPAVRRRAPLLAWAPLALALVAGLGGPLAYTVDTVNSTHTGAIPSAGPTVTGAFGGPGGGGAPAAGTGADGMRGFGGTGVAMGGLSGSTQVSSALIKLLEQDASQYKWIAATVGTQSAAPIELVTGGDAVLAIGGFNGTDPSPTLAQFQALVAKGEIHYYVGESGNSFGGGTGSSSIASWVAAHFKSQTVGGVTVYDLTTAK